MKDNADRIAAIGGKNGEKGNFFSTEGKIGTAFIYFFLSTMPDKMMSKLLSRLKVS